MCTGAPDIPAVTLKASSTLGLRRMRPKAGRSQVEEPSSETKYVWPLPSSRYSVHVGPPAAEPRPPDEVGAALLGESGGSSAKDGGDE